MVAAVKKLPGVTFNDLYEAYPDFDIDVEREQALLLEHDVVVLQHPFYWYSSPAIIKQWLDLVLEHGWAYGAEGTRLTGKTMVQAISCGGSEQAYQPGGRNRATIETFLLPFQQTARLCGMQYLTPFVVHGTHRLTPSDIHQHTDNYVAWLQRLTTAALGEIQQPNLI